MVITVDLSWNPDWHGEQTRYFERDGSRLVITTPEQLTTFSGDLLKETSSGNESLDEPSVTTASGMA